MLLAIRHSDETGWQRVSDLSRISDLRAAGEIVWAEEDVKNLGDEDVALIAEEFSLHELAVEDAVMLRQRRIALVNDPGTQRRLYGIKQRISRLRRYGHPVGRLVHGILEAEDRSWLGPELTPMFADVKDNAIRIGEQVSEVENLTDAILDLRRAETAGTLNEVTKKLTAWAAIIAVPTLISSVYGMNFHLFPTDRLVPGFWFAIGLMLTLGVGLFVFFKRRNWL